MSYVFDTSGLVESWNTWYSPTRFPTLWEHVDDLIASGRALAPQEVLEELRSQDDELLQWAKARAEAFIVPTSREVMLGARAVLEDHPKLTKPGRGRGKADPFVIVLAETLNFSVVTYEQGGTLDKPKIPFVCGDRGVACLRMPQLIEAERWTF